MCSAGHPTLLAVRSLAIWAVIGLTLPGCADDPAEPAARDAGHEVAPDALAEQDAADAEPADSESADTEAAVHDPCEGARAGCVDETTIESCSAEPGAAAQQVRERCAPGARCDDSGERVQCVFSGACAALETRCADGRTLASCVSGSYEHTACPAQCLTSPLGSSCAPELETRIARGRVEYEVRRPNEALTDWGDALDLEPGRGFWVLAYRGDELLDAVATSVEGADAGAFSIRVPVEVRSDDALVVSCVGADARGALAYVLADPGFPASETPRASSEEPPDPRVWSWRFPLLSLEPGAALQISEQAGSGAAFVFESMRAVFALGEQFYRPDPTQTLIGWLGLGTLWQCSTCYAQRSASAFGHEFLHQLRYDGSADQAYWSDAVTRHELGHYLMSAFGLSPRESAPRYFGEPTHPGLAWLEGWATFFSASERESSIYYDKQAGGFFWFDIQRREYAFDDLLWQRPSAAAGLSQLIDENEVAAMLWRSYGVIGERAPMLTALASPRMTVAPFERGYTRRVWSDPDHPENFTDTGISVTHLADFFDALRCADAIASQELDAITEPAQYYPYPSASPLCR